MLNQTVCIVDDDVSVRESVALALEVKGIASKRFSSAESFLATQCSEYFGCLQCQHHCGCLVLGCKFAGMSGLALQKVLSDQGKNIPIVFQSGCGDLSMGIQAMRGGAVDFIEKPDLENRLITSVLYALKLSEKFHDTQEKKALFSDGIELLTLREQEVMDLLIQGYETKKIANTLGIAARTVDNHRAAVLEKMQAENLVNLTRLYFNGRAAQDSPL